MRTMGRSRKEYTQDRPVELAEIGDTGRNNVDAFMHEQRMPSRGPRGYINIYIYLSVDRRRYVRRPYVCAKVLP